MATEVEVPRWRKMEWPDTPVYLDHTDSCYHYREYTSHGGWSASETNGLVSNFKKPVRFRNTNQWPYKLRAVQAFTRELGIVLPRESSYVVAPIPTSKRREDPEYDSRIADALEGLRQTQGNVEVEYPFQFAASHDANHLATNRMNPEQVYRLLEWEGLRANYRSIVLVDDVITCGAHYKACKRMLLDRFPGMTVHGVFWARTVWQPQRNTVAGSDEF